MSKMKSHKLSILCDLNSSMNIEENCQLFTISEKINVLKKRVLASLYLISGSGPHLPLCQGSPRLSS